MSDIMRQKNADPKFKAAQRAGLRRLFDDPEYRALHAERSAERLRQLNANPEFKAAQSERMRRLMADPAFQARRQEGLERRKAARMSVK